MIITHNIGILAARLKLTLLSSSSGCVIRDQINWEIRPVASKTSVEEVAVESHQAQPTFDLPEGDYTVAVFYQGEKLDLGGVYLKQNTQTDIVFILTAGSVGERDEYFIEHDTDKDFLRRTEEREAQGDRYGTATLPLRDPMQASKGELGVQLMSHPLLQGAQFDGVPPDFSPQPSENTDAIQLTLQAQLQNQPNAAPSSAPRPAGS